MFVARIQTGNSGAANLRATKSTGSQLIGTLSNGTNVNIVRCDDTWATLQYNGIPCFILLRLLDDYPVSYGEGMNSSGVFVAKCNGDNVNVRNEPNGTAVGRINKGDSVTVTAYQYDINNYFWYQIGVNQWVRGDFLAPPEFGSTDSSVGAYYQFYGSKTTAVVNCRETEANNAVIFCQIAAGTSVNACAERNSFGELNNKIKVQAPYGPHATLWGYCPREFIDVSYSSNNSINELFGTDFITTYSTGGFVYNLQNFLNRFYDAENRGNGIDVDGNFGGENSETRNAVREFQEFAGLDADGVVGNATKLALLQYVTNLNA